MLTRPRQDAWLGVAIVTASLLMLFVVIPRAVDSPENVPILALAPGFWPNVVVALMGLVGAVIAIQGFVLGQARDGVDAAKGGEGADAYASGTAALRVIGAIALLFAFYALLGVAGFVAASAAAYAAYALLGGERRWWLVVSIAALLPSALYYFFTRVANVYLPLGVFESWP